MAHPYKEHKEKHPGKARVSKMFGKFKDGGGVEAAAAPAPKKTGGPVKADMKAHGGPAKARMDKYARGGKVKHGSKGHHTKINIVVAPKAGGDAGAGPMMPPPGGPPPMGGPGGPPPGGPPMPPPGAGGLPGAGPGLPPPPGGMKRGGVAKHKSGIASKGNLKKWSEHASSNSRYERGGSVHMKGGAGGAEGRLDKAKAYGMKSHGKD